MTLWVWRSTPGKLGDTIDKEVHSLCCYWRGVRLGSQMTYAAPGFLSEVGIVTRTQT